MFSARAFFVATGYCLLALLPAAATLADTPPDERAERCVMIRQISSTEVIDDQNILFHMQGGKIYRNYLPHRCPGLKQQRTYMYRTSLSRLCDLDIITVLYDHGFGFTPGPSCGLGEFYPITKEEAKALKEAPSDIEPQQVPPAEPEEPEVSD